MFSSDPYIDYCIVEAVAFKVLEEEEKARKKQERENWKKGKPGSGL